MSYQPPTPPATWQEQPPAPLSHVPLDFTSARSLDDELAGLEDSPDFCRAYREGVGKEYSDLEELGCVRRAGLDRAGNPLYLIIPGNMLPDTDLVRVRRYAIVCFLKAHAHEGQPFSVIFLQNNVNSEARAVSIWFVVQTYRMLPRALKRNLRSLGIVHPAPFVRTCMLVLAPFLADSFWDKLFLIERLDFLDEIVGLSSIPGLDIPRAYFLWDQELDARAKEDELALRTGAMHPTGLGLGGLMSMPSALVTQR